MASVLFLLFLFMLSFSGYQADKRWPHSMTACLAALPSHHHRNNGHEIVHIYTLQPSQLLSSEIKFLRNCSVVKWTFVPARFPSLGARLAKNEVTARYVVPDSDDGRNWKLRQPVVAVSLPRRHAARSQLRVWMNCSATETIWRLVEACTCGKLQVGQSVVGKRLRRDSGGDNSDKSSEEWKHVVLPILLIASFTIALAMCAKSKSKNITSVENSQVVEEEATTKEIDLQKVNDDDVGVTNELHESGERDANKGITTLEVPVGKTSNEEEDDKCDAGEETTIDMVTVEENKQRNEKKDDVQTSDSGTFCVPRQEMFSGDGYARVRVFSNNADCVVNVGESDSEDDQHVAETEGETGEDAASSDLPKTREHLYSKVGRESPIKPKSTHGTKESPTQVKAPQATGGSIPPAHVVRPPFRFGSKWTSDRAPAPPPEEKGSLLVSPKVQHQEVVKDMKEERSAASTDNQIHEVDLNPSADAKPSEEDWYSTADVEPYEEDWYSMVDKTGNEDMTYSLIGNTNNQSGQQPPPLPPINKHPKAPFLFEVGKKISRDGPLPPTPEDDCFTENSTDKINDFSSSCVSDCGRSFTLNNASAGPKEDPPYDKPFMRSQSHNDAGLVEGKHIIDVSALYSRVDLSKKKRNVSAGEQQQHVENVDELYAKPFKQGRQGMADSDAAAIQDNTATAQLAEDGYSCVSTKSQRQEPNYSEVGPAARSVSNSNVKQHGYAKVVDVMSPKQIAVPDPGYDTVGAGSQVMASAIVPDPGYDSIGNDLPGSNAESRKDPDYENVNEASARGETSGQEENQEQDEQSKGSNERDLSQLVQEPNYDEIDDTFREQIELYRQRSESKGEDEVSTVL